MVLVRALSAQYTSFEILFIRTLIGLALIAPLFRRTGLAGLRTKRLPLHIARGLFAYFGMLGLFIGIGEIPLADVVALSFTQPIFIVLMAALLLGERFGRLRALATAGGFLGVLAAVAFFAWRRRVDGWRLLDFIAPCVPTGLAAGPLAPVARSNPRPRPSPIDASGSSLDDDEVLEFGSRRASGGGSVASLRTTGRWARPSRCWVGRPPSARSRSPPSGS